MKEAEEDRDPQEGVTTQKLNRNKSSWPPLEEAEEGNPFGFMLKKRRSYDFEIYMYICIYIHTIFVMYICIYSHTIVCVHNLCVLSVMHIC